MSTLDPGLEPPGDWQTSPFEEESAAVSQARRAAGFLWASAGLQLALSCCCGLMGLGLMFVDPQQVAETLPQDMPNREETLRLLPTLGPALAGASLLVLFIPALVLIILAFWVRRASRPATTTAWIILILQSALTGLVLLNYLSAMFTFPSVGVAVSAVLIGAVLWLFIKTCFELSALRKLLSASTGEPSGWS